ncbi:hypothetical protein [Micromonospora sp. NPDC004704]
MSRNDEPITPDVIRTAADRTVQAHSGNGWCYSCTDDGCAQLRWAYEVRRGGPTARSLAVMSSGTRAEHGDARD